MIIDLLFCIFIMCLMVFCFCRMCYEEGMDEEDEEFSIC